MRIPWHGALVVVVLALAGRAAAQYETPVEAVLISASKAQTWVSEDTNIALLDGPVTIEADMNHMTADKAVVWISRVSGAALDQDRLEIALIGQAMLVQPNGITRSGPRLYVDARVRGVIRLVAPRVGGEKSDSDVYRVAMAMRPALLKAGEAGPKWVVQEEVGFPTSQPTTQPSPYQPLRPVTISAQNLTTTTAEGLAVAVLSGKVALLQKGERGDIIELMADRAVVFTPFRSLLSIPDTGELKTTGQIVTGVYLEGDVRIIRTPADPAKEAKQQLTANRAFYDFTTDRAALTDVVLHTMDVRTKIPLIVRARMMRQLSSSRQMQEYTAEKARLTSSSFNTPSYSIGATSAYLRQRETGSEIYGTQTTFTAKHATLDVGPLPLFYLPFLAGTVTERSALYGIQTTNSGAFGFGVMTEWGLFESLGRLPPQDLQASYKLDYFSERGPALGFDAKYQGGFIEERELEPWSFTGDLTSYVVWDHGMDDLGRRRSHVEPDADMRGRFHWQHQHFFPGDWQLQLSADYISDATFMEQWFSRAFREGRPLDTSLYLKRQRDSEAITFLASAQTNDFATVADLYQEQLEVEKLPELGYRRIGDSIADDTLTFFSTNTVAAMRFRTSSADLVEDLGFRSSPGLPSIGDPYHWATHPSDAMNDDVAYRADFRQEIDWPFNVGKFRAVPYVIGRYTDYTESLDGGSIDRLYMGGGLRMTTAFWKVDDTVQSEIFDLHRLRHVVEPELNVYGSVQSNGRQDLLIYEEPVDAISDIAAAQVALHQRWQTKRGGPGNWRSVDVFTLNMAWNYFFNQPPDHELNPADFRGLYFVSMPEASIPRNSMNMDAAWRVSDNVQIVGDTEYNTDAGDLATASIGASVRQDPRLAYHLALRHIASVTITDDNGNTVDAPNINGLPFRFEKQDLLIFGANYAITSKYRLSIAHSYDIAQDRNVRSSVSLSRHFDRFFVALSARVDRLDGENAFFVNFWPEGLEPKGGSQAMRGYFDY